MTLYLLLFFSVVIIVVGTKEISSFMYQRNLFKEINNILNYVIYIVETELEDIERITFRLSTSKSFQSELNQLHNDIEPFKRNRIIKGISDHFQTYVFEKKYIQSIHLLLNNEDLIVTGKEIIPFNGSLSKMIIENSKEQEGRNVFLNIPLGRNRISAVRAVREYSPFTLRELGYVVLILDLDIYIDNLLSKSSYPFKMNIFDGDNLLFSNFEGDVPDTSLLSESGNGYFVEKTDGVKYFTIFSTFTHTNWRASIHIPYAALFDVLTHIQYMSLVLYGFLVFLLVLFSNKLILEIISPIENLTKAMKEFEDSNFERIPAVFPAEGSLDEINTYIRDFCIMTKKIELLITENYKKKLKLQEAEYKTLQAQINPHFLYNTFDSINWIAQVHGEDEISSMVVSLSSLLRSSINNKEKLIFVAEEMKLLHYYIKIQKIRYGDRLNFRSLIPDEILAYKIPKLTLQPLVENAINYSLEEHVGIGQITLRGCIYEDYLEISVEDNGPGMNLEGNYKVRDSTVKPQGSGHGLMNIDDRIRIIFGEDFGLKLNNIQGKGTTIILNLPLEKGSGRL